MATLTRMIAARTFFARMNEGRHSWMTEAQLVKGCEEFFKSNGYDQIERDKLFDLGDRVFNSLLVGSKEGDAGKESIASYFKPRIDKYDIGSFGSVEAMLYDLLDNYENTNLMLVTDSLSYTPMTKIEELSVALENLMDEGLFVLFMNDRSGYALFDEFKKLTAPIPVSD
ncbi:MAG: hypothetical protein AB1351_13810 [Thermoproteota archaeon]